MSRPTSPTLVASAVLCAALTSACGNPTMMNAPTGPTWYKDVLPITQVSCAGCHTTGGIAPFPLESYADAKAHAAVMANAVENKRMPPWLASKSCGGPFVGDRTLSDAQIKTITDWNTNGALEGNPADAPAPVSQVNEQLPKVDLTIQMPQAYTPSLKDDYRCFLIDPALTQTTVVTGYDIVPGNKKVVHHVILYVVPRNRAVAKDAQDTTAGWECFGGANVTTNGTVGAWAPGGAAVVFPAGTGIRIQPDEVIAMQVHYNTENGIEPDQSSAKLMFGTGNEKSAYLVPLVADQFSIAPNAVGYSHSETFPNNFGFTLNAWGFLPHMHTKGKKISIQGPNDACIVDIPNWDFHWQTQYFRKTAIQVPAGQGLKLNCTWDNPTSNTITWGEGTSDEMCFAFVYATL
ncbi:MAG: hypothetical protein U0228_36885 [Myxococcaceae bacterium]